MAEKSVIVFEVGTGKRVGTRDAVELDNEGEARVIERIDFSSGKFISPMSFPIRGGVYTKAFTSGGTATIAVGDILQGATSAATCRVISIAHTSGSWAGGDEAGTLTICDKSGVFQAEDLDQVDGQANICSIAAGDLTASTLGTADTFDLTSLPAELTQNLITVGDKSILCVSVEQYTSGGTAIITPIVYDNEVSPGIVAVLPARSFTQTYAYRRGSASGYYALPIQIWDVAGAYKIGLHLAAITGTSNVVKVYGWVL